MEIVIHGTNDGFRTLFATNQDLSKHISYDFRPKSNTDNFLGKSLYEIKYLSNGYVFTKYTIIKDTLRSSATGRIAFSVFVDTNKKLNGADLLNLLNVLSEKYLNEYVVKSFMNRGEYQITIREDFGFVNNLKNEFEAKETNNQHIVDLQAGIKEPAYIYYDSEAKMAEYFDKPYQEEYLEYKLIIFLEKKWMGSIVEDPIAILPNSGKDLTDDVKLDNEYYYLKNFNQSQGIKIFANGNLRSNNQINNCIRKYDSVKIYYAKNVDCFKPIDPEGALFSDEIQKYLRVDGNSVFIVSEAFINPTPIEKEFEIKVWTRKNEKLNGVKIQIGMKPAAIMTTENYIFNVKGEELRNPVKIYAQKDYFSGEITLNPLTSTRERELILNENHNLKIIVRANSNNGPILQNITFRVDGVLQNRDIAELTFIGEETESKHVIDILHSDFITQRIEYTPKEPVKNYETFISKKEVVSKYKNSNSNQFTIDAGDNGEKTSQCPDYSIYKDGSDIDNKYIKPNKGYEFVNWKYSESGSKITAQYKRKTPFYKKPKFIAAFAIGILVIAFGGWFIGSSENKEIMITEQQINEYLAGDSLLFSNLNIFQSDWKDQEPEIIDKRNWFVKIKDNLGLGNYPEQLDSTEYQRWKELSDAIDSKIKLRQAIDNLEFQNLKTNHLNEISKFKKIIEKIDSTKYQELKDSILTRRQNNPDLSQLPIYKVFELIKDAYASLDSSHSSNNPTLNNQTNVRKEDENKKVSDSKPGASTSPKLNNASTPDKSKASKEQSKQQMFEDEFWKLVNSGNINPSEYKTLKKKYSNVSGQVMTYLKKIVKIGDDFDKFSRLHYEKVRKNAKTISDLEKEK